MLSSNESDPRPQAPEQSHLPSGAKVGAKLSGTGWTEPDWLD